MDIHQTEEQQVEQLKSLWQEYGNAIIAGLVLGFGGFIGYGYYNENKAAEEFAASDSYQSVVELAGKDDEAFQAQGGDYLKNNQNAGYAALTALALAKDSAEHKDWPQVEKYLQAAIDNSKDKGISAIASLRLARVQIETEQLDKALATLSKPLPEAYKSAVEEAKGDAYLKKGDADKARAAYQVAVDSLGESRNPALQMKLDDLAENIVLSK